VTQRLTLHAVAFALLTAILFASADAVVKHIGAGVSLLVLLWVRYAFQSALMVGIQFHRSGSVRFASHRLRLQTIRAALVMGNAGCGFIGLRYVPLAEYTALAMLGPLASTLLGALVLGERVSFVRWCTVAIGFVGMVVMLRPGNGMLGWSSLFPLGAALTFGGMQLTTRRLAEADDMVTTNFYSGFIVLLLLSIAAALHPLDVLTSIEAVSTALWLLIALLCVVATVGQMTMVLAVRAAPLSKLAPFGYVQIAFAALLGWMFFNHAPDTLTIIGMLLIAAGGAGSVGLSAREARAAGIGLSP
jgi:drug/metabolite transporter (DMT)-like permease